MIIRNCPSQICDEAAKDGVTIVSTNVEVDKYFIRTDLYKKNRRKKITLEDMDVFSDEKYVN